jgi:2'-5' RNA ligase
MRLFIAIELPETIKQAIAVVQARLKADGASANWTRPEGIHLTLKFLGEVEEAKVPGIVQALDNAARGSGPLKLSVAGAGAFPNGKVPRVLWLGVTGDLERLASLQMAVEDAMEKQGFEREARKFSPHLTLARIKFPKPRDNWQERIDSVRGVELGSFEATQICLMQSELRREGAVYTEIARIELKEA